MTKKSPETPETFLSKARKWAVHRKLFGNQAFLRYVMFTYLDALNQVSKDFIFKGGNLLWVYIRTPRGTIDLDLSTITMTTHSEVKKYLEDACHRSEGITFSIKAFQEISRDDGNGASVTVEFTTDQDASNTFEIDIVYAVPTDFEEIKSPVAEKHRLKAATIENIIVDKLIAAHQFAGGNTRMKDFDDLWRLAHGNTTFIKHIVRKMLDDKNIPRRLDLKWINPAMEKSWKIYNKRYADLPEDLARIFKEINQWLMGSRSK